ncbi:MAG: hypothetical protein PHD80_04255, partial [Candidatus ainarchaeum sp.]|nr:hypothetical protein [Candidatus ainarchaeum sp.]
LRGLFADVGVVSASYGYYSQVGGLVGHISGASGVLVDFNDSSVRVGVVSGGNYVGGAVGYAEASSNDDATGVLFNNLDVNVYDKIISTGHDVGGLVGNIFSKGGSIRGSGVDVNYISVVGNSSSYVGGLVGKTDGNIYNSHSVAQIDVNKNSSSPDYLYLGGLAGQASFIDECYSDVNIDISIGTYSGKRVGGLVGLIDKGVKNSYSKGGYILATKNNGNSIGGLVGYVNSSYVLIENSYSSIEEIIKGNNHYAGGLIGYATSGTMVTNSFSTTTMNSTGGGNVGGLIGYPSPVSGCTNSYYLEGNEVMLYSASPSSVSSSGVDYFKGNLTNEPMVNWSSLIWVSEANNYPQLIN